MTKVPKLYTAKTITMGTIGGNNLWLSSPHFLMGKEEDGVGKLCLPMHLVFDAIKDAHVSQLAHLKPIQLTKLFKKYGYLIHAQYKEFVCLCPV
jgi:hypothetical protein